MTTRFYFGVYAVPGTNIVSPVSLLRKLYFRLKASDETYDRNLLSALRWLSAQEEFYYHFEWHYDRNRLSDWKTIVLLLGFHREAEAMMFRLQFPQFKVYRETDQESFW